MLYLEMYGHISYFCIYESMSMPFVVVLGFMMLLGVLFVVTSFLGYIYNFKLDMVAKFFT